MSTKLEIYVRTRTPILTGSALTADIHIYLHSHKTYYKISNCDIRYIKQHNNVVYH